MKFIKKATVYQYADAVDAAVLERALAQNTFTPVGTHELASSGWAPVFEGQLMFSSHKHLALRFALERKKIPASVIDAKLRERCKEIEDDQGFAPGKKARAEIKEQVFDALLPQAFPVRSNTTVLIDTERRRIIIDSTTVGVVDSIISSLVKHGEVDVQHLTAWPSTTVMGGWLVDEDAATGVPDGYSTDDAVSIQYPGESGTLAIFRKADLGADLVTDHIARGAQVASMAMTWERKISFTLHVTGVLTGVKALDVLQENQIERDADRFENDFILMTGEMQQLIDSLIENS